MTKIIDNIRKRNNDYVLFLFKSGLSLSTVDRSATWYPPRPTIKKNAEALAIISQKKHLRLVVDNSTSKNLNAVDKVE